MVAEKVEASRVSVNLVKEREITRSVDEGKERGVQVASTRETEEGEREKQSPQLTLKSLAACLQLYFDYPIALSRTLVNSTMSRRLIRSNSSKGRSSKLNGLNPLFPSIFRSLFPAES